MEPGSLDAITDRVAQEAPPNFDISRRFTVAGQDPFETVDWSRRAVSAGDFSHDAVEAPTVWTDQSVAIVAKLYFATVGGVREDSVRQLVHRVAMKITREGIIHDYFPGIYEDQDPGTPGTQNSLATIFYDELVYTCLHQYAAFNTPVWLNLGVPGRQQSCSACYLLSVEDHMLGEHSITDWWAQEAAIFKSGAGSGVNLSNLRGSMEPLSTGGVASGPVAYMRPADAGAGTLKSGGAHRRAAKMIQLDADHPDILDFIDVKTREDARMRILKEAGVNLDPFSAEGERNIAECTSFQNGNISVRVSDKFMDAVAHDREWELISRVSGEAVATIPARALMRRMAEAAWRCADPGIMFDDTINGWHTTPAQGPITTSNPCGETHLNDDSSCNLASLNLVKFLGEGDNHFAVDDFRHVVDVMVTAMDITCSFSDLPTELTTRNTRDLRQLGLGYTNLGAALMVQGFPYDSMRGREWAASITALLTGRAYYRSAQLAATMGPFAHWAENSESMLKVIGRHCMYAADLIAEVANEARSDWMNAAELGREYGYRNAQASVVAPTGTTSFFVGADTTGVEPAFSLVTTKNLAAAGTMTIVNGSVGRALETLGYVDSEIATLQLALVDDGVDRFMALLRKDNERDVFATAMGSHAISPQGHLEMVAAIQPFLSGATSKTLNIPADTTVDDIYDLYIEAWNKGVKCVAVYRDGSKTSQVLSTKAEPTITVTPDVAMAFMAQSDEDIEKVVSALVAAGNVTMPDLSHLGFGLQRKKMPLERHSLTHKFSIGEQDGYITAGMYEDGTVGEVFITGAGKEGSTLQGMMGAFSIAISYMLQYGVPLEAIVEKYSHMKFEPSGPTKNPEIPFANSIPDYIARWLASRFGDVDLQDREAVLTDGVKAKRTAELDKVYGGPIGTVPLESVSFSPVGATLTHSVIGNHGTIPIVQASTELGPPCGDCGAFMRRSGSCHRCDNCGASTGCG